MKTFITDFQPLRPKFQSSQEHSLEWIARAHAACEARLNREMSEEEILIRMRRFAHRYGCSPSNISGRGHELDDFVHHDWEKMRLFNFLRDPAGPDADQRTACYEELVDRIFERFYEAPEETAPSHLIHVTCTGYISPSAAQKQIEKNRWHTETAVTHAYHMGCAAAMPALRIANGFLNTSRQKNDTIDIVHTELCSLHLEPRFHTPELFVVQSLFADGYVRYRAVSEEELESHPRLAFEIIGLHEETIPDSLRAMIWRVGSHGMAMTLEAAVAALIASNLTSFLARLFARSGLDLPEEIGRSYFAIHPGGPKVIDQIGIALHLSESQLSSSRGVFFDYGNMSSATLPHIWERMARDPEMQPGSLIISLAFAPGLTVSGALFQKVVP